MNTRMVSLFTVAALCLSLCAGGCQSQPNNHTTESSTRPDATTTAATSDANSFSITNDRIPKSTYHTTAQPTTSRAPEVLKYANYTWQEVPVTKEHRWMDYSDLTLDLRGTVTSTDYAFSGTVLSRKEYDMSRTDKDGKTEPFGSCSIIEVKVNHVYHGKLPINGDIIRLYYNHPLYLLEKSVVIQDQKEYVFMAQSTDDYAERNPAIATFTDASISLVYYHDIFPIENENVLVYKPIFDWDKKVMKKVKPGIKTDRISSGETGETYIVLDKKDFDPAFLQLFKNPETLPTSFMRTMRCPTTTTTTTTHQTSAATKAGLPTVNTDPTIVWSDPEDGES